MVRPYFMPMGGANLVRIYRNQWQLGFCLKKMKKAVDSFKIGCYSNKAVAQDGTRKKGAAKSKSF